MQQAVTVFFCSSNTRSKLLNHTVTQTNLQIESRTIAINMNVKVEKLVETFSAWFDTDLGI